jgi:hypothetical protein
VPLSVPSGELLTNLRWPVETRALTQT